ncbi:MAG: PAS domain S-box protein, partial [Bacteroidales bacterium]
MVDYSKYTKKELIERLEILEANEREKAGKISYFEIDESDTSLNLINSLRLSKSLLRAAKTIPSRKTFYDAAESVFQELKQLIGATAGYIALLNKDTGMNDVVYLDPGDQLCTVDPNLPMPVRGFRAQVYQSREVKYNNDFKNSEWVKLMPKGHTILHNVMFVPMLIDDEAVGLIGLSNKAGGFTDEDAEMAKEFGLLAVIALNYSNSLEENTEYQNKIKESEEKYRSMIEDSPVMIWESGTDAKCTYFNNRWLEFRGRTMDEEIGDGWTEGLHPDDYDDCVNSYLKAFEKREKFKIEYRLKNKDGIYRWILDIGTPQFHSDGNFKGYIGSCIDITEQKKIEQIQKEKEEFYYALFEKNKAVKLLIDPVTGKIEDANTAASEFYGYSLSRLRSMKISDINQLTEKQVQNEMQKAMHEKRQFFEFKHQLANGEVRDVAVYSGPIHYKERELLYSIIYDITDQKRSETALKESEEKYRHLYLKTPVMLHSIDAEGRLISVSDYWLKKLGYERHEVLGRKSADFLTSDSKIIFYQYFPVFLEKGEIFDMQYQMVKKSGEIMDVLLSAISEKNMDGSLKRTLAVIIDVTEQKKAEIDLAKLERKSNVWLENSPVCTKVLDIDFNLQYMSQSGIRELQIEDINEFYGKPYPFHFYPDSFKIPMNENLRKAKETGKTITQEAFVNDIKGNKLWYHSTIVPVYNSDNKLDYMMVVSSEITKRKIAEQKLINSEEKFRLIVNALPQFISYCSVDFKYFYVNKSYEKEFGIKQKDIENQRIVDIIGENAFELAKVHMQKVIEGEYVRYYEKLKYKNGSVKHIDGQLIPHFNTDEKVVGYYGVLSDISPYIEAQELQEKSEKEKSIILETMSEMLTYYDKDLNIIWANKASRAYRNIGNRKIEGFKCYEVFENRDTPCPKCPVIKSIKSKRPEETEIKTKDEKYYQLRS